MILWKAGFHFSDHPLAAEFTISAAIAHSLLAEFFLMHASRPHFSAPAATVAIVVAMVTRSDVYASRSNVDVLCGRHAGDSKQSGSTYGEDVFSHSFPPLTLFTQQLASFSIVPQTRRPAPSTCVTLPTFTQLPRRALTFRARRTRW